MEQNRENIVGKKRTAEEEEGWKLIHEVYTKYDGKKKEAMRRYSERSKEGKVLNLNQCFKQFQLIQEEEFKEGNAVVKQHGLKYSMYSHVKQPISLTYADFFDFMSGYFH